MPPRTRVPCIWTTSWPGVPGSPSKPGTVALRRRPRSPPSSLPSWAGDRQMLTVRWSTIKSGLPLNASRNTSRTTCPRTPPASALPTSEWAVCTSGLYVPDPFDELGTIHPTRSVEPHTDCALGVRSRHALHDDRGMSDKPATVRDLIGAYLAEQCTVLIDSEAQLRAGEDVVHTTRVAVRRLRSTIRVFADLFDRAEADDLESELIWWATLLGEVRDLDILTERQAALLSALPPELMLGPVSSTIQTELATRRKRATDDLIDALNSERYREADRPDPPLAKRSALHRGRRFTDGRDRDRHQDGEEEGAQAALHSGRGAACRRALRRAVSSRAEGVEALSLCGGGCCAGLGTQGRQDRCAAEGPTRPAGKSSGCHRQRSLPP